MGIRTKARGSTVDLIIADENPGNSEVPSEVSEGMNNKLCPPFSFPSKSKISNGATPADIKGGIPCLPTAKMGSHLQFSGMNSLRKRQDVPVEEDPEVHLGLPKMFSLRELQIATDKFSSSNILGRGGFGEVYKGRLADGSLVAVKRIKEYTSYKTLQFDCDVEMKISMMISMAHHRNLLRLRGFCRTRTELLFVYPYMANGSVALCLRERPISQRPLDWPTRKRIALGSARGLSYLHDHRDPKIIHRDIKPANILLDEEFEAVVGDFGLAMLMDFKDTHVKPDRVCGTYGYMAPEYAMHGTCSEKIDVYGYGIMLLELITGQRVVDLARLVTLPDWAIGLLKEKKLEMLVDPDLDDNYVEAEVEQLIQVSLLCTQDSPMCRPTMSEVVRMLEGDGFAKRWDEWQKMEAPRSYYDYIADSGSNSDWIVDSTPNSDSIAHSTQAGLSGVELSGPRWL